MKKTISSIAFICFVLISTSIFAQNATLPANILKTLTKEYPNAQVQKWEVKSKGDYKIKFELDGKKTIVEIDDDGTWEKTTTHLSLTDLPPALQSTVKAQKKNSDIKEIKMITDKDGDTNYKVELTDGGNTTKLELNKKGQITKSETKKK
ncbi:MAG: PepSY-like domain-containing protein [Flavobacteriales bacterium]|nr:PepSY-like domain-containing protein [Flavobacteriales bacterium]